MEDLRTDSRAKNCRPQSLQIPEVDRVRGEYPIPGTGLWLLPPAVGICRGR